MCEEQRGEHVDRIDPIELLCTNRATDGVVQVAIACDTGAVDENINLELLRRGTALLSGIENDVGGLLGLAQVCLDVITANAMGGGQRGAELFCVCARGLRCEIQEEVASLSSEVVSNRFTDPCNKE